MQELNILLTQLDEITKIVAQEELYMKTLKNSKAKLQQEVIQALHDNDMLSTKRSDGTTYSIAKRKDFKVANEATIINTLKELGIDHTAVIEKLDTKEFKKIAKGRYEKFGEILNGSEFVESENLVVKKAK